MLPGLGARLAHLAQRSVRVALIIVGDPAQMRLAQDDNIVNTLATDRPDQSFGEAGPVSNDKFPRTHKAP